MRKRFLGIICLIYSSIIAYVWIFDKLKNFLAPTLQIYIKLSLLPLLVLGIILLGNKKDENLKISDLILLIPLVFLICAGDGRLTSSLAGNRLVMNTIKQTIGSEEIIEKETDKGIEESIEKIEKENKLEKIDYNIEDSSYSILSIYLSFADKAIEQEGKTIRIRGFVTKDNRISPSGYFGLGKYEISCCVADASFIGFAVKESIEVEENNWYEIEGTLKKIPSNTQGYILGIDPISIKKINEKEEESYVYPCYNYGEDACNVMTKFGLSY